CPRARSVHARLGLVGQHGERGECAVARHGELALALASQLRTAKACSDVADVLERYVERHKGELGPTVQAVIAWE
ncbi:MAG TPA: hypothetical protein PK095_16225, partial [Myxococcota bacterium]|nr:hypothetical protein [Myxococcota bacterium]